MVALESTVIAHGLPHPRNLETARSLEDIVRSEGAHPATIGVVDGVPVIGLTLEELERLAAAKDVVKASARDLGPVMASGRSAATTVAATAVLARRAGIRVFATGGIGGVHRGGEASLDVSADLAALARTPIAVVSAGAKAILDLGRTLEALETLGVPVVGLGTDEFPAFYVAESGHALEHRVSDEGGAALIARAHWSLGLESAVLVCNPPPPSPEWTLDETRSLIERAEADARAAGIEGKALTPWLLDRIASLTEGRSVDRNVELLESNARAAARLAVALAI